MGPGQRYKLSTCKSICLRQCLRISVRQQHIYLCLLRVTPITEVVQANTGRNRRTMLEQESIQQKRLPFAPHCAVRYTTGVWPPSQNDLVRCDRQYWLPILILSTSASSAEADIALDHRSPVLLSPKRLAVYHLLLTVRPHWPPCETR